MYDTNQDGRIDYKEFITQYFGLDAKVCDASAKVFTI